MANIPARDGSGNAIQFFALGTGTALDPYRYTSEGFLPFIWRATVAGTGYAIGDRLVLKQESNEAFQWYRINATGSVASLGNTNVPATNREEISGGGTATLSGGGVSVLYDIVGGATGLEGGWDIANARVFPDSGAAAIAIGTNTGQATNVRFPSSSTYSDPTTPTIRFATFTTELTPQTFTLTNCRMLAIVNQTLQTLRYAFVANDTINNPNHSLISSAQPELAIDKISRTGLLEICAETVPAPVIINNCSTTTGSAIVTGTGLNNIYVGQAITGAGIPGNTYIASLNTARTQLTLCSASGAVVNATATGTVSLTFSGAVIRLTTWS